ncbi:MAG TPA: hypothetical protein VJ991_12385 [Balneolales bacterium]|nr:hypothetical protein [Balneolales bacterium]
MDKELYDVPVNEMQEQIDSINRKLDIVLEEIELQRRHRRAMEDLQDDLVRVGKGVYQSAVEELEQVHDYMDTSDVLFLGKLLLRNINNLTRLFQKLESTMDFFNDSAPITRELAIDLMNRLDEYERKGYFRFIRDLSEVLDKIVTTVEPDDIQKAGNNLVNVIETAKKSDLSVPDKISLISLLRELNSPEMKRAMAVTIRFVRNISNQPSNKL